MITQKNKLLLIILCFYSTVNAQEISAQSCLKDLNLAVVEATKVSAKIYERLDLPVNAKVFGPAILEQPDTTIFIEPKMYGEVDKYGNLIIRWNKE